MRLSASMMCAKMDTLGVEVEELDQAGIDSFHIDIMDGQFVPNLGMGLQDIQCIRRHTQKPMEVHLMVCNNEPYLDIMKKCGVNTVYIHPEGDYHPFTTIQKIRALGMEPGIVIDPGTSVESVMELFNTVHRVIVMAVPPGKAGQGYLPYVGKKVEKLLRLREEYKFEILWDGACTEEKVIQFVPRGVDAFVLGTALLFNQPRTYDESIAMVRRYER